MPVDVPSKSHAIKAMARLMCIVQQVVGFRMYYNYSVKVSRIMLKISNIPNVRFCFYKSQ